MSACVFGFTLVKRIVDPCGDQSVGICINSDCKKSVSPFRLRRFGGGADTHRWDPVREAYFDWPTAGRKLRRHPLPIRRSVPIAGPVGFRYLVGTRCFSSSVQLSTNLICVSAASLVDATSTTNC